VKLQQSAGAQSATYSITVPAQFSKWLSVSPTSGTLSGAPQIVNVTIDRSKLANGTYSGEFVLTVNGATELTTVQVTYNRNDATGTGGTDGGTDAGGTGGTDAGGTGGTDAGGTGGTDAGGTDGTTPPA
jgi:hypothetical protein